MRLTISALLLLAMSWSMGCQSPQPGPTDTQAPVAEPNDPMVSVNTLLPAPDDFAAQLIGTPEYPIPPYAEHLNGVRICLDPGHGGQAHKRGYKRGPTGVREAEMNLRVAQYLAEFLRAVGTEVILTRDGDYDMSLAERAGVANDAGADIFISLHHNAISNKPEVNRTSVWYHKDVDYRPSNLDLARYLLAGLQDSLALEQVTGVPLKSDQLMYEGGFGVLRHPQMTAALCESSFFTNPEEEQRLRDPAYNLLEAWGLFTGLARYAAAGLPHATLVEPADGLIGAGTPAALVFQLDDGLRSRGSWGHERQMIVSTSISVRVDGQDVPFTFTNDGYKLVADVPALEPGEHAVEVQFVNMFKNSVLNPHFVIEAQ
ncbi:MAG: N-acetylmuramoyl-L-alanine amidase [Phycisphaerae bacterium]|nr:N-acetylmuramoyl-L-alanine amidase [Phycisphaerae bacterium]